MKINFKFIYAALAMTFVFFTGCEWGNPDKCVTPKKINCGAHGICLEGICGCDDGYVGDSCTNLLRNDFIGNYKPFLQTTKNGTSTVSDSIRGFQMTAPSSDVTKVNLIKFANATNTITATFRGPQLYLPVDEVLTIPTATGSANYTIVSGKIVWITNNKLKMEYDLKDASNAIRQCNVIMAIRQ